MTPEAIVFAATGALISAVMSVGVRALWGVRNELTELKTEFRSHRLVVEDQLDDHEDRLRRMEAHRES